MIQKFDELILDVFDYSPNIKMSSHTHEPVAFSYVLRGSYDERIGNRRTRNCKENTLVFHPANETHAVEFSNCKTTIFRVTFSMRWIERIKNSSFDLNESVVIRHRVFSTIMEKMYSEFLSPDNFSSLVIEGLVLELFVSVARSSANNSENKIPVWLERVRESLHESYANETSLQILAETVGIHPVYLARQFRKFYRTTVGEYVRQVRVEKARQQLSKTKQSISEIALSTGFYDQSHFSNVFKKQTGMTPVEFRLNQKER